MALEEVSITLDAISLALVQQGLTLLSANAQKLLGSITAQVTVQVAAATAPSAAPAAILDPTNSEDFSK